MTLFYLKKGRLPAMRKITPADKGMTGAIVDDAVLAAVADGYLGGVPAVCTFLLGGLATAGAQLELDDGDTRGGASFGGVVFVLSSSSSCGEANGFVGDAEAHVVFVVVVVGGEHFREDHVSGKVGLDYCHGLQSVMH
jgi:hypothetical protein